MKSLRSMGFTLMELMISISIFSMVMMVVSMSLHSGVMLNDRVMRQTDINNRANGVLNQLAMQLRMANAATLDVSGYLPSTSIYTAQNPSNAGNVKAFKFNYSSQLATVPPWSELYETQPRVIVYDYSVSPGRLSLISNTNEVLMLTPEVDANGFSLVRIGNTLQMSLTLRSETRSQETILYTAQAQTLFLRSTINKSSGTSTLSFVDDPLDVDGISDASPTIMFGYLVTPQISQDQVSLFVTAPIGQTVNPNSIQVIITNLDGTISQTIAEGATVTVGGATLTRATFPPASQWPSRNGSYSVTLTGNINTSIFVKATASTTSGIGTNSTQVPSKRYN